MGFFGKLRKLSTKNIVPSHGSAQGKEMPPTPPPIVEEPRAASVPAPVAARVNPGPPPVQAKKQSIDKQKSPAEDVRVTEITSVIQAPIAVKQIAPPKPSMTESERNAYQSAQQVLKANRFAALYDPDF